MSFTDGATEMKQIMILTLLNVDLLVCREVDQLAIYELIKLLLHQKCVKSIFWMFWHIQQMAKNELFYLPVLV